MQGRSFGLRLDENEYQLLLKPHYPCNGERSFGRN